MLERSSTSVWLLLGMGCACLACGRDASGGSLAAAGAAGAAVAAGAGDAGGGLSGAAGNAGSSSGGTSGTPSTASPEVGSDAGADAASLGAPCLDLSAPVATGAIDDPALDQLSGLVASRSQPGLLFAHEDSTGTPTVYALEESGRVLAELTLAAAPSTDWEDIAVGPGPGGQSALFIGDIGDNAVRTNGAPRGEIQVIRLPEPQVALGEVLGTQALTAFDVLRFTYPSGVHESETLLVHPVTGDIVIITRSAAGDSHVFRAPGSTPPDTPTVLEEIGRIAFDPSGQGALATGGDISPNGDRIVVRTYTEVFVWAAAAVPLASVFEQAPRRLPWAEEPQGEAITFLADGSGYLLAGEQASTIYRARAACP